MITAMAINTITRPTTESIIITTMIMAPSTPTTIITATDTSMDTTRRG